MLKFKPAEKAIDEKGNEQRVCTVWSGDQQLPVLVRTDIDSARFMLDAITDTGPQVFDSVDILDENARSKVEAKVLDFVDKRNNLKA